MIRVRYPDDRFDMVKVSRLDLLLETSQISSFERASGWVDVNRDPVRDLSKHAIYLGVEKRDVAGGKPSQKKSLSMKPFSEAVGLL